MPWLADELKLNYSHIQIGGRFGGNDSTDFLKGIFLHRLWSIKLDIKFPENVQNWYGRLAEPAEYRRWVMSDFAKLQGRSGY